MTAIVYSGERSLKFFLKTYKYRFIYYRNTNTDKFDDDMKIVQIGKPIVLKVWRPFLEEDIFVKSIDELVQADQIIITIKSTDGSKKTITYTHPVSVIKTVKSLIDHTKNENIKEYLQDQVSRSCIYCGKYSRFIHCAKCNNIVCDECDKKGLEHKQL